MIIMMRAFEGVSTRKHLTAILEEKKIFWHQASQHDNPDLLNHTKKGKFLMIARKKCKEIKRKTRTVFLFNFSKKTQPKWQLGAILYSPLRLLCVHLAL